MPFVTQSHRDKPDLDLPGDRCYVVYRSMVAEWNKNPRWTTADKIFTDMKTAAKRCPANSNWDVCPSCVAYELAWQMFFQLYVIPYELKKKEENGDI